MARVQDRVGYLNYHHQHVYVLGCGSQLGISGGWMPRPRQIFLSDKFVLICSTYLVEKVHLQIAPNYSSLLAVDWGALQRMPQLAVLIVSTRENPGIIICTKGYIASRGLDECWLMNSWELGFNLGHFSECCAEFSSSAHAAFYIHLKYCCMTERRRMVAANTCMVISYTSGCYRHQPTNMVGCIIFPYKLTLTANSISSSACIDLIKYSHSL